MAASTTEARPRPYAALLCALPIAIFAVVGLEATRAPRAESAAALVGYGLIAAFSLLWAPLAASLGATALVAFAEKRRIPRIAVFALASIVASAATLHCHAVVSTFERFRFYPPLLALFALLFVFLFASLLAVLSHASEGPRRRGAVLVTWLLAAIGFLGFAVTSVLNRRLFLGGYPTLHLGMLEVSYFLLFAGVAALLCARPRVTTRIGQAALGASVTLAICSFAYSRTAAGQAELPTFRRFTDLGRSDAMAAFVRTRTSPAARPPDERTEDAYVPSEHPLATFERLSGLPPLPADFDLARYNVLLISIDTIRCRDTSVCQTNNTTTPNLAAFSREHGYTFTRAYASGTSTLPSMSSMLAMTYPSAVRLVMTDRWHGRLSGEETTVADLLRPNGWRTFYAGHNYKRHFSRNGEIRGLQQGFADRRYGPGGDAALENPTIDAQVREIAVESIDAHVQRGRPFFGWIFFESPHEPYLPRYDIPETASHEERYRGEIRYVDEQLGLLLAHLTQAGLLENTIIIIHGDHGEAFAEHGVVGHGDIYEEVSHVPLVIHVPGATAARIEAPTSLVHVFPWLLLRGPEPVRAFAEQRVREHIAPMMASTRGAIVIERLCPDGCKRVSLVDATHRIIRDDMSGYMELYDLEADPSEHTNLYDGSDAMSREFVRRLAGYDAVHARIIPR